MFSDEPSAYEAEIFKHLLCRYANSLNISEYIHNVGCLEDGSPFGVFQGSWHSLLRYGVALYDGVNHPADEF
ncbi:hypothetical protein EKG38_17025 [Shewanella canadensis]|uniref:Uncharacterized protein n=1 Tax=Shewanella canadensis TaxID=271096 RepID=A0A431WQJ5_9GAMM|nr:hypothetical protein [Shewanella canadensis]RTR37721.1 hypothetical protein EKG38_17025 [Shewanella canadensis]